MLIAPIKAVAIAVRLPTPLLRRAEFRYSAAIAASAP